MLDAMGVIFESADDVAELLIPFIGEYSDSQDESLIQATYLQASPGTIAPEAFWTRVGISADVGVRKPDAGIYRILQQHSGYAASELPFIDDRAKNVQAALDLGIESILFAAESGFNNLQRRLSSRLGR
ncbi:MAG: hypothetical protein EP300_15060 [Gammaproteobacteria bacterium]|nr:MAG: hypothetical protein EP300_15060 [Gammaproteobacteria bacterium]